MTYPVPIIDDILAKLQEANTFVILDLNQVYLQIQLDEDARKLLVVNTPWGLFEYFCLPFGLTSSTFIFKKFT